MSTAAKPHETIDMEYNPDEVSPLTSDADSDHDDRTKHARTSTEVVEHDRQLLTEEEQRENLLGSRDSPDVPRSFFSKRYKDERPRAGDEGSSKRQHRRSRKRRKDAARASQDEAGELMYEMEEGGPRSDTSSRASSSSAELDKSNPRQSSQPKVSIVNFQNGDVGC